MLTNHRSSWRNALFTLLFCLLPLAAQTDESPAARLRVLDASGSALSNLQVILDNTPVQTAAPEAGWHRLPTLQPGEHRLQVRADGFAPAVRTFRTEAGQPFELTIQLDVATVSSSIEVTASGAEVSSSVTKSSVPLLEVPQSISLVTREQMTVQAPQTMQEALRYVPGVRAETYGFDARGDWASIRGGSFGQFLNGMRMLYGSYNNIRPEPFALEQIEVMRGPSSVLFGQGGFGGVVNLVTKRPQPVQHGEVQLQLGSFGRKQLGVDLTGPVGSGGKLSYRLVGVGRDSNTQVNFVPDDRVLAAPSLTWHPRPGTTLTLLGNFQEDRMGSSVGFFPWRGTLLAAPNGQIHTSTFISEPGFDDYRSSQRAGGYLFEHRFADRWAVRQNFYYSSSNVNYQSIYSAFSPRPGLNADDRTINRVAYVSKPYANSPTLDTSLETHFRTGFLRHTFLAGHDFQQASITGSSGSGSVPAIDVYAPVYGNYTVPRITPLAKSRQRQNGLYVQDQLRFGENWALMLGLRHDWAIAETVGSPATRLDTTATTGRAGLVYTASNGLAPYFSYTESFLPVAGFDFYNRPYQPQRGKQWETGVKYAPGTGRLLLNVSLFDLRETNRRTPDPANPANSIQIGEAHMRGAELEARGRTFFGIDAIASYAYDLARVSRSNSTDFGKRLATMPLHVGSLWLTRRLQVTPTTALTLGPGLRYTGSSFDGTDSLKTPSYLLFDAMAAVDNGPWRLAINAANAGDRVHVTTCLARGDCFYGSRRNVMGSLSFRF